MNCGKCEHWDKRPFEEIAYQCHTKEMVIGECRMAWAHYQRPENKHQMVATCNSEGIYGELITQENFGCILFKHK